MKILSKGKVLFPLTAITKNASATSTTANEKQQQQQAQLDLSRTLLDDNSDNNKPRNNSRRPRLLVMGTPREQQLLLDQQSPPTKQPAAFSVLAQMFVSTVQWVWTTVWNLGVGVGQWMLLLPAAEGARREGSPRRHHEHSS